MKIRFSILFAGLSLLLFSGAARADDDIEGRIQSVNRGEQSFVVKGIKVFATPYTEYDDGLRRFEDLRTGQEVEVEFYYHDGKQYAEEIELDD